MLRLAGWLGRARYDLPVEVFSVNYDPLLELALEALKIPYFDGFVGNLQARFRADLVEGRPERSDQWLPSFMVRLWKLHGSVNWAWLEDDPSKVVRLGAPVADGEAAAIYPSDAKYDESRRVPFLVLHDRFRLALAEPESLVLVSGYSFSDDHLNETLFEAAEFHPRSEICCFASMRFLSRSPPAQARRQTFMQSLRSGRYVGAIGSRRAHADRLQRLRQHDVAEADRARRGTRRSELDAYEAQETALSVLAEIVAVVNGRHGGRLASGTGPIHARS